ncbi:Ig-like domain-containing protein, partial [uncultured Acinetobacter sp.]
MLEAVVYQPLDSIEPLLYTTNDTSPWAWAAIPVAAGGILWWAHQHDSKNIQNTEKPLTPTSEPKAFDDVGIIQGQIKAGSATDDNQPTFKGIGTSGQIITIYDGNVVIGTTIVSSDGTWTFTPTTPLADGDHIISYTIKDHPDSVESGKSPVLDFILDTTAPAQPSAPTGYVDNVGDNQGTFAGGTATDDTTPGIVIGPVAEGNTPKLVVDGQVVESTYDPATGTLTPVNPIGEGSHDISYTITDPAGNTSTPSDPIQITVDTTAPAQPAAPTGYVDNVGDNQGTFAGGTSTDDTTPGIVIGTVTDGNTPTLLVDGQVVDSTYDAATGTLTPVNPIGEGSHDISYTLTDPAGNTSTPSDPI